MKKTNTKWTTFCCGRCGEQHVDYTGKLDKNGIEYVVCGTTSKRMNVSGTGKEGNSFAFPTLWLK
jgi:transcription elongation factor Elf1